MDKEAQVPMVNSWRLWQTPSFNANTRRLRLNMPVIEKPHFTWKVEQPKSAFAEGNARW